MHCLAFPRLKYAISLHRFRVEHSIERFRAHVIPRGGVQHGTRMLLAAMVLCVVSGCSKWSGRDIDVLFYRIPKVITNKGEDMEKLSRKRRAGFFYQQ